MQRNTRCASDAKSSWLFCKVCRRCAKVCRLCQKNKKAMKSFDFTAFSGAMEGTRTPGLLIRSQSLYPAELPAHILLAFSPENVFYYSAHRPESQAFFSKNSKNSVNGHLSRKSAACGGGFSALCRCLKTNIELTNTLQHFII